LEVAQLREKLEKVPFTLLLVAYLGYLGYDYYSFVNDPSSPLVQKQGELVNVQNEINKLKERVKKAQEFYQTLNAKKMELRALAKELEDTRTTISDAVDVPELMKTILIEARRAGLKVIGIKPAGTKAQEYFEEQDFELVTSGVFFQYVTFLDRVSNLQRILRVDNIEFAPSSPSSDKYVELKAKSQVKAYHYLGSQADDIAKAGGSANLPQAKPSPTPGAHP
jgi:Tfp pilus assembly protein PilO